MASATRLSHENEEINDGTKSYLQKSVTLTDWWLIKPENCPRDNALAVGGFTFRNNVRLEFYSAPVEKVFDVFTLETTDGICIILQGLINETRTKANGFSQEVFNQFGFGFPPHWERLAAKDSLQKSPPKTDSENVFGLQKSSSRSESVPEVSKTRKKIKSVCTADLHEPVRKRNSKKRVNQREETGKKVPLQKNTNKAVRTSQRLHCCDNKQNQAVEGGAATDSTTPSSSGSSVKRKLEYVSPISGNGKPEASAPSTKPSTVKRKKTTGSKKIDSVNAKTTHGKRTNNGVRASLSPQSLSCKRSRSGRLLLPPLEFWRNQRAVYDADRRITGVVLEDVDGQPYEII